MNPSYDLILKTDGASRGNPGHAGIGGQILSAKGDSLLTFSEYIGTTTNNVAEYRALIFGLEGALSLEGSTILVRLDSELLVRQLNGAYKVKNSGLKPLFQKAVSLLAGFKDVKIEHVFRDENREADILANQAIDDFLAGHKEEWADGPKDRQIGLFE